MSDVMELKGRKKAQQNVFHRLLSRPDEYVVEQNLSKVSIIHHRVSHCQLCGNNIHYDFLLEHSKYPHKNLYIGSDCFAQFLKEILDKIMPNQAESILRNIELAMERAVEKEKAKVFLETYPNFVADVQSLYQSLYDLLNVYNLWYEFNRNNRMDIFDVIESVKKDLQKGAYTTKPKVEKIQDMIELVKGGKFEKRLKNHVKQKEKKLTIQNDIERSPKNETFYDMFFKYVRYMSWSNAKNQTRDSPMLSKIEKDIFLKNLESYLGSRKRSKTKLKKQLPVILENFKTSLLDSLKVQEMTEYQKTRNSSNPELSKYVYFVSSTPINKKVLIELCSDYGFVRMNNILSLSASANKEAFVEKVKSQTDYKIFDYGINFKTNEEGQKFCRELFAFYEQEIEEIRRFVDSDELAIEDFN